MKASFSPKMVPVGAEIPDFVNTFLLNEIKRRKAEGIRASKSDIIREALMDKIEASGGIASILGVRKTTASR